MAQSQLTARIPLGDIYVPALKTQCLLYVNVPGSPWEGREALTEGTSHSFLSKDILLFSGDVPLSSTNYREYSSDQVTGWVAE